MSLIKKLTFLVAIFFISGCGKLPVETVVPPDLPIIPTLTQPVVKKTEIFIPEPTTYESMAETEPIRVWINPLIFDLIKPHLTLPEGMEVVLNYHEADYQIDLFANETIQESVFVYYFVFSVPFTEFRKNIHFAELKLFWNSDDSDLFSLWIKETDLMLLETIFGPLKNPNVILSDIEPDICKFDKRCYRIHRIEEMSPRWRVISVDSLSLLDRSVALNTYPLKTSFMINKNEDLITEFDDFDSWFLEQSNFNQENLTILMLTGTTALTRGTAFQMEKNGVAFPLQNIADVLHKADILHVSHEVPMFDLCPPAVPLREEMRFCSSPTNIELFKQAGVDVVELTGNHLMDWGPEAFLESLAFYSDQGFKTYGSGETPAQAEMALEINDHGNQFVFIGCNVTGPENSWVTDQRPGVYRCDQVLIEEKVKLYRNKGFIPIVTYQHYELDGFSPNPQLQSDFLKTAEAGAVIVSGSQAHFPLGFDFVGNSFIDYGLGNLFFDQMQTWYRKATIDVHYFYKGNYINTELVSIINENQGQPRLMNDNETHLFLNKMFEHSFYYENQ